jgi:hypothetical protein
MRYYAKVVRLRFEAAYVEIEDDDLKTSKQAPDRALDVAIEGHLDWRLVPFDREAYAPHIEMLVSDQELAESDATPALIRRWMRSSETSTQDRYLLLYADTETGEGHAILQPWHSEAAGFILADVCGEWIEELAELSALALQPPKPRSGPATIIPFPTRRRAEGSGR